MKRLHRSFRIEVSDDNIIWKKLVSHCSLVYSKHFFKLIKKKHIYNYMRIIEVLYE